MLNIWFALGVFTLILPLGTIAATQDDPDVAPKWPQPKSAADCQVMLDACMFASLLHRNVLLNADLGLVVVQADDTSVKFDRPSQFGGWKTGSLYISCTSCLLA